MEMMFAAEPMAPQVQPKPATGKQSTGKKNGKSEKSFDDVLAADHGKSKTEKIKSEKSEKTETAEAGKNKKSEEKVSSKPKSEKKTETEPKENAAATAKQEKAEDVDPKQLTNVVPVVVPNEPAPQTPTEEVKTTEVAPQGITAETAVGEEDSAKGGSVQEDVLEKMFRSSSKDGMPLTKQMQEKLAAATQGQADAKPETASAQALNQTAQVAQNADAQATADAQAETVNRQMTAAANGDSIPKEHQKTEGGHQVNKGNPAVQNSAQQPVAANLEAQADTTGEQGESHESHENSQQVTAVANDPHGLNQTNDLAGKFDTIQNGQHNQVAAAGSAVGARGAQEAALADSTDAHIRLASGETVSEKSILEQISGRIQLQAHDGRSQIKIDLHPQELGKVKLHMVVEDSKVHVHLQAQSSQVQDVLENHLAKLRESFAQQGLKLDQVRVSVDSGQTDSRGQFQDQYASSQQQRATRYHSNSYRVSAETETQAINAASGGNTNGLSGLSLRI